MLSDFSRVNSESRNTLNIHRDTFSLSLMNDPVSMRLLVDFFLFCFSWLSLLKFIFSPIQAQFMDGIQCGRVSTTIQCSLITFHCLFRGIGLIRKSYLANMINFLKCSIFAENQRFASSFPSTLITNCDLCTVNRIINN